MLYFKACPKCQGDICFEQDHFGSFIRCLQCGLLRDVQLNQVFRNAGDSFPAASEADGDGRATAVAA